jgi:hypothetical protein
MATHAVTGFGLLPATDGSFRFFIWAKGRGESGPFGDGSGMRWGMKYLQEGLPAATRSGQPALAGCLQPWQRYEAPSIPRRSNRTERFRAQAAAQYNAAVRAAASVA